MANPNPGRISGAAIVRNRRHHSKPDPRLDPTRPISTLAGQLPIGSSRPPLRLAWGHIMGAFANSALSNFVAITGTVVVLSLNALLILQAWPPRLARRALVQVAYVCGINATGSRK
jgi:hypothetical protein